MTKPGRKQLKQTFQQGSEPGHWKAVREMLRRHTTHFPEGVSAKMILMELSEISARFPDLRPLEACGYAAVLKSTHRDASAPCPSPARASTEQTLNKKRDPEVRRAAKRRSPQKPEFNIPKFTQALLRHVNEVAGTKFNEFDQSAERAVWVRLNGTSHPPAATEDQVREVVRHYAREWAGTKFAVGLHPKNLLGEKFWARHGAIGAEVAGKHQAGVVSEEDRAAAAKRREDAAQRLADEAKARFRAEQARKEGR